MSALTLLGESGFLHVRTEGITGQGFAYAVNRRLVAKDNRLAVVRGTNPQGRQREADHI